MCVCRQAAQTTNEDNDKVATNFFKKMVCVDSKYLLDSEEYRHTALSGVRAGTMYHVTCLVKNREPQHVVQCVSDMWLAHNGVPETVVVDQVCEFESTMAQACEDFVIDVLIYGSHAGWHQGLVERHGGLFVEIGSAAVCEFHLRGKHVAGHAGEESNSDEVRCHSSTDCVRTSIKKVSYLNKMRRTANLLLALESDGPSWLASQVRTTARFVSWREIFKNNF